MTCPVSCPVTCPVAAANACSSIATCPVTWGATWGATWSVTWGATCSATCSPTPPGLPAGRPVWRFAEGSLPQHRPGIAKKQEHRLPIPPDQDINRRQPCRRTPPATIRQQPPVRSRKRIPPSTIAFTNRFHAAGSYTVAKINATGLHYSHTGIRMSWFCPLPEPKNVPEGDVVGFNAIKGPLQTCHPKQIQLTYLTSSGQIAPIVGGE